MSARRIYSKAAPLTAYEQGLNRQNRQANGIYYTPEPIIRYIIEHTLEQVNVTANPFVRVLDPACGSGLFLVAAYDVLYRKFMESLPELRKTAAQYQCIVQGQTRMLTAQEYWQPEYVHQHLLRYCLFGADSDAAAIALAAGALAAKSPEPEPSIPANLVVCDSLMKWEQRQPELFDRGGTVADELANFWRNSFDYVIGNPPYIPVTRLSSAQKDYFRTHYKWAMGRLNTFVLFLERAIEKATGKIGMIVPSRLLLNTQYAPIRQRILQQCEIEKVYEAREDVFAGATVDTVVVILRPGRTEAAESIMVERQCEAGTIIEQVDASSLLSLSGSFISFAAGATELAAVHALERSAVALSEIADIRDGIIQGAVGPELFLGRQPRPGSCCKRVLTGQMIEPFCCRWQGEYIWYDPIWLTELENSRTAGRGRGLRLRQPAIFEHPKILSRQTSDRIIAAMDTEGLYYMNTLHGITVTDTAFDPWYVLAVMNSEIIRCWYAWRFAETGRSFAQVKIANLRQLPVLCLEPEIRSQISRLAYEVSCACLAGRDATGLLANINDTLYRHSNLDDQMVHTMRQFANSVARRKAGRPTIRR